MGFFEIVDHEIDENGVTEKVTHMDDFSASEYMEFMLQLINEFPTSITGD